MDGTPVIETHLASSEDSGGTWHYEGPLWEHQEIVNPSTGRGFLVSREIPSLAVSDRGEWFAVRPRIS